VASNSGASDTAVNAVIDANFGEIEKKPTANPGHGSSPRNGRQAGSKYEHMNTYVQMYTYLANAVESCQVTAKSRRAFYPKLPNNPRVLGGTFSPFYPSLPNNAQVLGGTLLSGPVKRSMQQSLQNHPDYPNFPLVLGGPKFQSRRNLSSYRHRLDAILPKLRK
jgi:hypothetical protein